MVGGLGGRAVHLNPAWAGPWLPKGSLSLWESLSIEGTVFCLITVHRGLHGYLCRRDWCIMRVNLSKKTYLFPRADYDPVGAE